MSRLVSALPLALACALPLAPAHVAQAEETPAAAPSPASAPPAASATGPARLNAEAQRSAREGAAALRLGRSVGAEPFCFEGDLVFEGARLGSVSVRAEPAELAEKHAWWVVERTVREAGKGRVVQELACYLAPNLALIQGELLYRSPSGESVTSFGRRDGRMEVTEHESGGASRNADVEVAADATIGLFAASRFAGLLRQDDAGPWILPVFEPRHAFGDDAGKPFPAGLADLLLEALPSDGGAARLSASATSGRAFTIERSGALGSLVGLRPAVSMRAAGSAERLAPPDWFDRIGQAPQSALQAFCAFGRGYHLPKRDLLEASFHWPSMLAHEVAAGTFPAGTTETQVRDYYVAEFEGMSKHRTEADCDDLLVQLLVSATITRGADGSLTVATLPVFGGHAYTMRAIEGRWYIVALD